MTTNNNLKQGASTPLAQPRYTAWDRANRRWAALRVIARHQALALVEDEEGNREWTHFSDLITTPVTTR